MTDFDQELDYNADIETYRRSRQRLVEIDTGGWSEDDRKHVSAMIRDCDYVIEWLETGRRPGSKRGVERLAAYQREIPFELMEKYAQPVKPLEIGPHTEEEWAHAEYILEMLTDRERECYVMHIGGQLSFREIGKELGINAKTVHENVTRAQNKVKRFKAKPMPLLLNIVV